MTNGAALNGVDFLDRALERIDAGAFVAGQELLYEGLINLRDASRPDDWTRLAKETIPQHPLCERIHRDPIARRSFEKPRGYAGDAVLLDYIYGILRPEPGDEVAEAIYAFGAQRPANLSVRRRRTLLAQRIDEASARAARPIRVLSVASGHLREAELSKAFAAGRVEEYVALDSDMESCDVVARTFPEVQIVRSPFTALYRDRRFTPRFDFIYSAGLYDYLEGRIAEKLTARLFQLLAPGGHLLVTNFLRDTVDAGYMESFMGWDLIFRDADEISGFARRIPADEMVEQRTYVDSLRTIGYLELVKR